MQSFTKGHVTIRGTIKQAIPVINPALLFPTESEVTGIVDSQHITLLHGLFPTSVINWDKEVNDLLRPHMPKVLALNVDNVANFNMSNGSAAIVILVRNTALDNMTKLLQQNFPHIDSVYPTNHHITLMYVHRGAEQQVVATIKQEYKKSRIEYLDFYPTQLRVKQPSW